MNYKTYLTPQGEFAMTTTTTTMITATRDEHGNPIWLPEGQLIEVSSALLSTHWRNPRLARVKPGEKPWVHIEPKKNAKYGVNKIDTGKWGWDVDDVNQAIDNFRKGLPVFPDVLKVVQSTTAHPNHGCKEGDLLPYLGNRRTVLAQILAYLVGEDIPVPVVIRKASAEDPQILREMRKGNNGRVDLSTYEKILLVTEVREEVKDGPERSLLSRIRAEVGFSNPYISQLLTIGDYMGAQEEHEVPSGEISLEEALCFESALSIEKADRYIKEQPRVGIVVDDGDKPQIFSRVTGAILTAKGKELKGPKQKKSKKAEEEEVQTSSSSNSEPTTEEQSSQQVETTQEVSSKEETSNEEQVTEVVSVTTENPQDKESSTNTLPSSSPSSSSKKKDGIEGKSDAKNERVAARMEEEQRLTALMNEMNNVEPTESVLGQGIVQEQHQNSVELNTRVVSKPPKPEGALSEKELKAAKIGLPFKGDLFALIQRMSEKDPLSDGELLVSLRDMKALKERAFVMNMARVFFLGIQEALSGEHQKMFIDIMKDTWGRGVGAHLWTAD